MGGVATPVIISGQSKLFRDNQSYSGTIWAKADFRDPSETQVKNSGLSRRFRDSWQLSMRHTVLLHSQCLEYVSKLQKQ